MAKGPSSERARIYTYGAIAHGPARGSTALQQEYEQAVVLERRGDLVGALRLYQKGAAAHYPDAENALGYMYDNGLGTAKKDPVKALEWWTRAAQQQHAGAQHNVALWYSRYA